mmetsp:Transcript_17483/g.35190  ORF Transcript_17483/g.35190 Transcript_17483/m.35190 type:complete len:389 (+) Transcript_17483:70-1236(+)|eukprot:scaffold4743_cov171-Amphora_coffeaeformis.AAC.9
MSGDATLAETASSSSTLLSYLWPVMYRCGQVVFGILAVAAGLLYVQQESLLYFPTVANIPRHNAQNPRGYKHPGERGLEYSSHIISNNEDGKQTHAWFLPHPTSRDKPRRLPTVLFFHGNAGNIGLRIPNAVEFLRRVQANFVLVEYRGYGDSPGDVRPTEAGLKSDAVAAWEYCRTELAKQKSDVVDPNKIYAFGRSLGGAVAVSLVAHAEAQGAPLRGLILENTFTSISDMVDQVLPFLSPIKRFVLRIGWNSLEILQQGRIQATPMLFLAGDADTLVPHAHMQQLRDAAHLALMPRGIVPVFHVIRGGTHNESWLQGGQPYWQSFSDFITQTSTGSSGTGSSPAFNTSTVAFTTESSSIPLMSNQLAGMARDALSNNKKSKDKNT